MLVLHSKYVDTVNILLVLVTATAEESLNHGNGEKHYKIITLVLGVKRVNNETCWTKSVLYKLPIDVANFGILFLMSKET